MQAVIEPEQEAVYVQPPELENIDLLIAELDKALAAQRTSTRDDAAVSITAQLLHLASSPQGQKG